MYYVKQLFLQKWYLLYITFIKSEATYTKSVDQFSKMPLDIAPLVHWLLFHYLFFVHQLFTVFNSGTLQLARFHMPAKTTVILLSALSKEKADLLYINVLAFPPHIEDFLNHLRPTISNIINFFILFLCP